MKLRSIRFRLAGLIAAVAIVSVVAALLLVRSATRTQFAEYVERVEAEVEADASSGEVDRGAFDTLADRLGAHVLEGGSSVLGERLEQETTLGDPPRVLLLDAAGALLATSEPTLAGAQVERLEDGALRIEVETTGPSGANELRSLVLAGPTRELKDSAGRTVATLHLLPVAEREHERYATELIHGPELAFLGSLDRRTLVVVLVAGAVALALAFLLARRLVGPLERLTEAVRRMESGDLDQRVDLGGDDEVGALARAFDALGAGLRRTEELRRNLVADVAHELRTPLTRQRVQLEAMQDGLAVPSAESLSAIHAETLLLGHLVDDLQDLALAEAGQLRLDSADHVLRGLVEQVATGLDAGREETTARLDIDVPTDLIAHVDERRFRQVLSNLLENARVHSPVSGRISVAARDIGGDTIELCVADEGPGIAAHHLPHLFERFYRTDPSRQRRTGGAGLGLAIVRHLVEAMGGRVRVESEPGRGSRFIFSVPGASASRESTRRASAR